jgi:hypothetical protein
VDEAMKRTGGGRQSLEPFADCIDNYQIENLHDMAISGQYP